MRIHKIEIKNFRLLKDVSLLIEPETTVIVGRNNSGKTSLTELFRRLTSEKLAYFALEDFSLASHAKFWEAFQLYKADEENLDVRKLLPVIETRLTISYDGNGEDLGSLTDFIIDLDPNCHSVLIALRYELGNGNIKALFEGVDHDPASDEKTQTAALCKILKNRVPKLYRMNLMAIDYTDPSNTRELEWSAFQSVLKSDFINAQRGLDDETHREKDVLGKILLNLFQTANSDSADPTDKLVAEKLALAVSGIQQGLDLNFNDELKKLIPALSDFGYPGFSDPELLTETTLDVQRLLSNNTKMRYTGANSITLPEAYSGLGTRNLVFILLKLVEFYKTHQAHAAAPGIHLVFVEEPEAHLHPQMQEVFIRQLSAVKALFTQRFGNGSHWQVQFVISTHSSHIANEAPFEAIRYFLSTRDDDASSFLRTRIKDLRLGLSDKPQSAREFLHKYMTLTRCDLLFADKAVLIEGSTERLLLSLMIKKTDSTRESKLANQYVSVMEVGGAYAHLFFDLLVFLELRTLIITDLDAVDQNDKRKACKLSDGNRTSNACLTHWFDNPKIDPNELVNKPANEKIRSDIRLAYETPETHGGPCGRTFEDTFMLANPDLFHLPGNTSSELEQSAWDEAQNVEKTNFALKYAIEETNWNVPLYIKEGLDWLAEKPVRASTTAVIDGCALIPDIMEEVSQ